MVEPPKYATTGIICTSQSSNEHANASQLNNWEAFKLIALVAHPVKKTGTVCERWQCPREYVHYTAHFLALDISYCYAVLSRQAEVNITINNTNEKYRNLFKF
jgi:hypothetical protein